MGRKDRRRLRAAVLALGASVLAAAAGSTTASDSPTSGDEAAARIVGTALVGTGAYERLAQLTDRIGNRLSGSAALERAVSWAAGEFRKDAHEKVWTEPVLVPHWVRGDARVRLVAPVERDLAALALGGSVATPESGIKAEVVEFTSFEELEAHPERALGKIALFNRPIARGFDSESGYGSAVELRAKGASKAARHGAVAMLLRSLGTADFRLPHTGAMRYEEGAPRVPAAAISAEDAALIHRLLAAGDAVQVELRLGCRTLDDAESANVIAEIPGRERPDEIVLIAAHLDSWDVGQGAHDDGAGCAIVMETLALLKQLALVPRRTIRAVLFTNEENGLRGGQGYFERHGADPHVAAIESDSGGFAPIGFGVTAGEGGVEAVREIARRLAVIGADAVSTGGGGADISPLKKRGVPRLSLRQESSRYFDYHHTEADTLDKVDRHDLDRDVAALALMAYSLAEREATLPPPPPDDKDE